MVRFDASENKNGTASRKVRYSLVKTLMLTVGLELKGMFNFTERFWNDLRKRQAK